MVAGMDSGVVGLPDAAIQPDAALLPDAAVLPDAAPAVDAATPVDASVEDAAQPDAAIPDAGTNRPPVTSPDTATAKGVVPVAVDVLANDADPDGDTVTLTTVGNGANGTATVVDGRVRYVANAGYSGMDALTYSVEDGRGGQATGTLTVTVELGPVAVTVTADGNVAVFDLLGLFTVLFGPAVLGIPSDFPQDPVWSPDGTVLAVSDLTHAWVVDANGASPRKLDTPLMPPSTYRGETEHLSWSPNGLWLAVVARSNPGPHAIFVARADGTAEYTLVDVTSDHPSWTSDNALIYSRRNTVDFEPEVVRYDVTLDTRTVLFPGRALAVSKQDVLLYELRVPAVTMGAFDWDLQLKDLTSTDAASQLLMRNDLRFINFSAGSAVWSPDGQRIAFSGGVPTPDPDVLGGYRVVIINVATGEQQQLYQSAQVDSELPQCLAWLPVGHHLSFYSGARTTLSTVDESGIITARPEVFGLEANACPSWKSR